MKLGLLLLLCAACSNTWAPQTSSTGWHACERERGVLLGCPEWNLCVPHGCEFFGDPNGPGPGDVSSQSDPPGR